jgi:hypothetical protein
MVSNVEALRPMDYLSLHKWTFTQLLSIVLTIPVVEDMPSTVGVLGVMSFCFASWRQFMAERRRQAEEERKKELHRAKMQLLENLKESGMAGGDLADVIERLFD